PSLATFESIHQAERARCKSEVLDHIAYLADALHAERPELFVAHALWMKGFASRQGQAARGPAPPLALSDCLPAAPGVGGAPRASARPASRRPPLSQPPPPPVPLPASPELAERAQPVLHAALAELAREGEPSAPPGGASP